MQAIIQTISLIHLIFIIFIFNIFNAFILILFCWGKIYIPNKTFKIFNNIKHIDHQVKKN